LAGLYRWFVKKYGWLVYVREKYYFDQKFMIVYDKPQPNEHAVDPLTPNLVISSPGSTIRKRG
jgi:hypothetical protein